MSYSTCVPIEMRYTYTSLPATTTTYKVLHYCRPSKKVWFLVAFACLVMFTGLALFCVDYGLKRKSCYQSHWGCICDVFLKIPKNYITDEPSVYTQNITQPVTTETNEVEKLKKKIKTLNEEQTVLNLEKFGPINNETIVIAIQAFTRIHYLRELIRSLGESRYIEETLIVFSHGFYDEDVNRLIRSINFTRVMQIYFPFGLQTHPHLFPGVSPNDCPFSKSDTLTTRNNCTGKARDVKSLQVKHHWWWKINAIFDHLRITKNFNGLVFFLEEDHFVFPDVIYTLKLMRDLAPKHCPDCNIFGLGLNPMNRSVRDYDRGQAEQLKVVQWNNMGFAFNREFWRGLSSQRCSDMFCTYNDYNWDFTLAYLSHKCLPQELKPLNVVAPRVFHIGDCGTHFHGTNCSAFKSLIETRRLQASVSEFLFPAKMQVLWTSFSQWKVDGHNGGWDDPRDIALCQHISQHMHEKD